MGSVEAGGTTMIDPGPTTLSMTAWPTTWHAADQKIRFLGWGTFSQLVTWLIDINYQIKGERVNGRLPDQGVSSHQANYSKSNKIWKLQSDVIQMARKKLSAIVLTLSTYLTHTHCFFLFILPRISKHCILYAKIKILLHKSWSIYLAIGAKCDILNYDGKNKKVTIN